MTVHYFSIPSASIFMVEGRDARRYLNARLTYDIRQMPSPSICQAAMLTANGKTEGLFRVASLDQAKFLLIADAGDRDQLRSALTRFIVADRVEVKDLSSEYKLVHTSPASQTLALLGTSAPEAGLTLLADSLLYRANRGFVEGLDLLCNGEFIQKIQDTLHQNGAREVSETSREIHRIRSGQPAFPSEIHQDSLFQESGLAQAISFGKGCYVGQEVIEKVDAIGRLGKRLVRLSISGELPSNVLVEGNVVTSPENAPLGKLLSVVYDPSENSSFAFASLKNNDALVPGCRILIAGLEGTLL